MERIETLKTIVTFKTSDGRIFDEDFEENAKLHQDVLDGVKKICPNCNGRGYILNTSIINSNIEDALLINCFLCDGERYLETNNFLKDGK